MRLSHRLTLVFSLFGLAIAGGLQINHVRQVRSACYDLTRTMAEGTTTAVRALVEDQARSGNFKLLGRNLEEMVRQSGMAQVVVKDRSGRRLVGRSDDPALIAREPHPGVPIEAAADGIYDVQQEADLGPRGKGTVLAGFHTDPLKQRLHEIASQAVRFAVMAFLAVALLAWLIGTHFGLRLEKLVPRIEALPRDPEAFRPIREDGSDDELARLVTAYNNLGATLKREMQLRRELEREKQDLSAMLVHDLKTPLTVIRSGLALLHEQLAEPNGDGKAKGRKGAERGSRRRTFELLDMSTSRLHRMVEDVLQLARLEEVAGLRERALVDLGALASACVKDFALVVADRKQKISLVLPKKPLPRVLGDQPLLRRVLDNLVHNAVEHTPAGGTITVAAGLEAGHVRVSVSDSGPGVPPEARAQLFQKFFQKDLKRHVGNVGLGLALCEKVVTRHEGSIGIEDAKPHGACFYFLLPVSEPGLPLREAASSADGS
ncbi:MAG: HAMP domain-containing histidine kinase [Elusimicrobia bacterium]|nr:HAMP domain-containing histidine kinase [Elusimicrobiota bacterium]